MLKILNDLPLKNIFAIIALYFSYRQVVDYQIEVNQLIIK